MHHRRRPLLHTAPHPCGYLPDRETTNLVLNPAATSLGDDYPAALAVGFRRAGPMIYRPQCQGCHACVPCRIRVAEFHPSRSQRRCLKRNADLDIQVTRPGLTDERLALYRRYMHRRHRGGGMDPGRAEDFKRFLDAHWSPTVFLELRNQDRLLAVAVTDVCDAALSAVYTFFDPAESKRSLGTCAILQQVQLAQRRGKDFVYLGYWIAGHPKMDYKVRFNAVELYDGQSWKTPESN